MRPLRLEVKGFSAFRDTASISFEGADLIAFVGPTGSGKSSLIDAMTFALYGTVARYDDQRLVEPVIHKLSTEARVRLDFEVGGERYVAVRVATRTKSGATTKEARLIHTRGDDSEAVMAGSAREMAPAVLRLIGLDFEQFTRTVVLPQGDFAQFLHADKSTRQRLLRQLLDVSVYEQMGRVARERQASAQGQLDVLIAQRVALEEVTPEQLQELTDRIEALGSLQRSVTQQVAGLGELDRRLERARESVAALSTAAEYLRRIAVPDAVATLGPLIAESEAALETAVLALKTARAERDRAQTARAAAPDVVRVQAQLGCLAAIAELNREIEDLVPKEIDASAAVVSASVRAEETSAALAQAEAERERARTAAGLGAVIQSLAVGELCPVCAQTVQELPTHDVDKELAAAEAAVRDTKAASRAANDELSATQRARDAAASRLASLRADLDRESARFPELPDEASLCAQMETARSLEAAFAQALDAVAAAERREADARNALQAHQQEEADLRRELTAARDVVAGRRPPTPEGRSLQVDWVAFVAWSAEQVGEVEKDLAKEVAEVDGLSSQRQQTIESVEQACAALGVSSPLEQVSARIATALADAKNALEAAIARRDQLVELGATIGDLEDVVTVNREMGQLLSTRGFERWLVQSALDDLLARATGRLFELSGGQFSFESEDGEFSICDHRNADEVRSVRSLSGGETFLASLALALALAEAIADLAVEGAPRIESMFLDEGFGTLDDEARDLVATTLEELGASGRLIGIVTHIRDLADRMPVRFEVSKDSSTSRVERVEV